MDQQVYRDCKTKDCVALRNRDKWYGRACPNQLNPPNISHNGDCILCTQCLKACPHQNFRWSLRPPFKDLFSREALRSPETAFLIIVSGFMIYELARWEPWKRVLFAVPHSVAGTLNRPVLSGTTERIILFVLFPLILWGVPGVIRKLAGGEETVWMYFRRYGLAYLPVVATSHMVNGLRKRGNGFGYLRGAIADPAGVQTAKNIMAGNLAVSNPLPFLTGPVYDWLLLGILLLGIAAGFSVVAHLQRRRPVQGTMARATPYVGVGIYGGLIFFVVVLWRFTS